MSRYNTAHFPKTRKRITPSPVSDSIYFPKNFRRKFFYCPKTILRDGIWFLCMEARTSSAKNMISGYIGSCKSARAALLLLLTLLPFRFTLPLLFTLDALLLLLPGDRSHQTLTTKSPDKIRLDFIFFFFHRSSSMHIKVFAFRRSSWKYATAALAKCTAPLLQSC